MARGDCQGAAGRLAAAPRGRLRLRAIKTLTAGAGWAAFSGWLGLAPSVPDARRSGQAGHETTMRGELRAPGLRLLKDQYDWAARILGGLPAEWRANMARALA